MTEAPYINPRTLMRGFRNDLHYPCFRAVTHEQWSLRIIALAAARGYWGNTYPVDGTVVLAGNHDHAGHTWMSLLPSELESQEIGMRAAHGHTVIMGLGMGWLAANVALCPRVTKVTVIERDANIIEFITATGVLRDLPALARDKIVIIHADALHWRAQEPVDVMQADIWRKFVEDDKLLEARRMQANVGARQLYFWGQEMEFWRFACRRSHGWPNLSWPLLRTIIAEDIRLPLIVPDWPDYPEKIANGARWWTPADAHWWR